MPIVNVQRLLEEAAEATLAELIGDDSERITVNYHLAPVESYIVADEGESLFENHQWSVSLFITTCDATGEEGESHRLFSVTGRFPFGSCISGDPDVLIETLHRMWENYRFGDLYMANDLHSGLEQVAIESEGGTTGE